MSAEFGHAPNRAYDDQNGNVHLNGANLFDQGEGAIAQQITIAPAAGSTNQTQITFQVQDGTGTNLASVFELSIWLSDAATGAGLTATTASGTVGAGTAGTELQQKVSKKAMDVLTDATGKYVLNITDSGKTGFYPAVVCPGTGKTIVGAQLVAGNYG